MRFDNTKTISHTSPTANGAGIASETNVDLHAVKFGVNYRLSN